MIARTRTPWIVVWTVAVAVSGCGGSQTSFTSIDAGGRDSASPRDAGTDSGASADSASADVIDTGASEDAGDESEATYDFGCGGNTACALTTVCCATPGTPTTFACVAQADCNASDKIECDGPDECGGTAPVCCGVEATNAGGSYPQCNASSLGTSCSSVAACPTHLGKSCTDTTTIVICHVSSDCTDPNNNQCCTFKSGSATLTFCIDSLTATLGGATCH